jgi:hypothetical protein
MFRCFASIIGGAPFMKMAPQLNLQKTDFIEFSIKIARRRRAISAMNLRWAGASIDVDARMPLNRVVSALKAV